MISTASWGQCLAISVVLAQCARAANTVRRLAGWHCSGASWLEIYDSARSFFEGKWDASCTSPSCMADMRRLAYTTHRDAARCPVAAAVGRLWHLALTHERDVHGDFFKTLARPVALLQLPFRVEVELLTDEEDSLPRAFASSWFELLFLILASLSRKLCPSLEEDGTAAPSMNMREFCHQRPGTLGCVFPLPSCESPSPWRLDAKQIIARCWGQSTPPRAAACVREAMPERPGRLLELLVPAQAKEWLAVKNVLTVQHFAAETSEMVTQPWASGWDAASGPVPALAPCHAVEAAQSYIPAALCEPGTSMAQSNGHVEQCEVLDGKLQVVVFSAAARELPGCGVELEFSIHVDEMRAPSELQACDGIACREQCATWEGGHYLRFSCALMAAEGSEPVLVVPATTFSGHSSEPSLHTVVSCRFPADLPEIPYWLRAGGGAATHGPRCPDAGLDAYGRCWLLSTVGATCASTCVAHGLSFVWQVPPPESPMIPRLLLRQPAIKQTPWARLECYVPGEDRFHTAQRTPELNTGDWGNPEDWRWPSCRLACPCQPSAPPSPAQSVGGPLHVELREVDGVFARPIPLQLCEMRRPSLQRRRVVACTRPLVGAASHERLLADWLAYHRLLDVDHFIIYDADGSVAPLLEGSISAEGTSGARHVLRELWRDGRLSYVRELPRRLGDRMAGLYDSFWRQVGGNACIETLLANHCLGLAKSQGFHWLVFLRGLDKFLHADPVALGRDPPSSLLHRYLRRFPQNKPGFLVHRRDCGGHAGLEGGSAVGSGVADPAGTVEPQPVFAVFPRCEARDSAAAPGRDFSWVPVMRPGRTHSMLPNMPVPHNATQGLMRFAHVNVLRAQHFVRAFQAGGEHGRRHYDKGWDRTEEALFTELDKDMAWALPLLRQR